MDHLCQTLVADLAAAPWYLFPPSFTTVGAQIFDLAHGR